MRCGDGPGNHHNVTQVLALLDDESEQEIRRLLEYPSDTAGGLMTTEIAALPIGLTAGEAIERVRQLHEEYEDLSYVYVVDDDSKLRGVIYFRDLVFARPGASLDEVMVPDPVAVEAMTDRELVSELVQRYRLFGIPVTDENGVYRIVDLRPGTVHLAWWKA